MESFSILFKLVFFFNDLLSIVLMNFFSHFLFHQIEVIFKHSQLPIWWVKLKNELISLFSHFCIDHLVNIFNKLLALSLVVLRLSLSNVNQVHKSLFLHGARLTHGPHSRFRVLDEAPTERLQTVVEVPHREHDSRAGSEGLDLGAPVLESREELLHEGHFGDDVEVRILVHRVKEGAGKLLLRVYKCVKLSFRYS